MHQRQVQEPEDHLCCSPEEEEKDETLSLLEAPQQCTVSSGLRPTNDGVYLLFLCIALTRLACNVALDLLSLEPLPLTSTA